MNDQEKMIATLRQIGKTITTNKRMIPFWFKQLDMVCRIELIDKTIL